MTLEDPVRICARGKRQYFLGIARVRLIRQNMAAKRMLSLTMQVPESSRPDSTDKIRVFAAWWKLSNLDLPP
jgi:hypothetical protein